MDCLSRSVRSLGNERLPLYQRSFSVVMIMCMALPFHLGIFGCAMTKTSGNTNEKHVYVRLSVSACIKQRSLWILIHQAIYIHEYMFFAAGWSFNSIRVIRFKWLMNELLQLLLCSIWWRKEEKIIQHLCTFSSNCMCVCVFSSAVLMSFGFVCSVFALQTVISEWAHFWECICIASDSNNHNEKMELVNTQRVLAIFEAM